MAGTAVGDINASLDFTTDIKNDVGNNKSISGSGGNVNYGLQITQTEVLTALAVIGLITLLILLED